MTNPLDSYRNWLEAQIDLHQREVAKLTIALEVYLTAPKARGSSSPSHKPKKTRDLTQGKQVRESILAILVEGPATSREIISRIGEKQKVVWNCLYNLQRTKQVNKEGKIYSLTQ